MLLFKKMQVFRRGKTGNGFALGLISSQFPIHGALYGVASYDAGVS